MGMMRHVILMSNSPTMVHMIMTVSSIKMKMEIFFSIDTNLSNLLEIVFNYNPKLSDFLQSNHHIFVIQNKTFEQAVHKSSKLFGMLCIAKKYCIANFSSFPSPQLRLRLLNLLCKGACAPFNKIFDPSLVPLIVMFW